MCYTLWATLDIMFTLGRGYNCPDILWVRVGIFPMLNEINGSCLLDIHNFRDVFADTVNLHSVYVQYAVSNLVML